jgi:hypothetical protein
MTVPAAFMKTTSRVVPAAESLTYEIIVCPLGAVAIVGRESITPDVTATTVVAAPPVTPSAKRQQDKRARISVVRMCSPSEFWQAKLRILWKRSYPLRKRLFQIVLRFYA